MLIKTYAKINLNFKILSKLPNNYHKISSIFQAVDLYDLLTISKQPKGYQLSGSIICPTEENLITKAKERLENYIGKELPCRVHLIKSIPISAGLGGGSSNAAATLIGLNKIYSLHLNLNKLTGIGLKVGSDVPFFISNYGTALVKGIGEKVKPLKRNISKFYVLARTHKRINTTHMYKKHDKTKKTFFELAQESCSDIKKLYNYFSQISNECSMSGSGPTVFAGFSDYNKAAKSIEDFGVEKFNGDFFISKPVAKTYKIM